MQRLLKKLMIIGIWVCISSLVAAQTRVVVIPMSGDDAQPLSNIVTVAKQNGDFTDPVEAIKSIDDASDTNPYLVVVAPGVYDLQTQIVMKPFVSLSGSGIDTTVIQGNFSGPQAASTSAAVVVMASNTSLSNMTLQNNGGGLLNFGVVVSAKNAVQRVHLRDLKAIVINTNFCIGLHFDNSIVDVSRVEASSIGCNYSFGGQVNNSSEISFDQSKITGTGGSFTQGLRILNSGSAEINSSQLKAMGGVGAGLVFDSDSTATVRHSTVIGGTSSSTASYSCVYVDDGDGNELNEDCKYDFL